VVIGAPLFNRADYLREALDSLLAQTFEDFALVAVDDASSDATPRVLAEYARRDERVVFRRNDRRSGMIANWRRVYRLALERHPEARYFAWASDHDVWHPRWLEALVAELEAHPEAVLAYPLSVALDDRGEVVRPPWRFDTAATERASERLDAATRDMRAGDMVYGLFRADAVGRAGTFRSVLWPDRLLLAELTAEGRFRQVPEVLWYRRFAVPATARRQRAAFFPERSPIVSFLPWWLGHAAALVRKAMAGEESRRGDRLRFAAAYLALAAPRELARAVLRVRNRAAGALIESVPGLRAVLAAIEGLARARGRELKLLPDPPVRLERPANVAPRPQPGAPASGSSPDEVPIGVSPPGPDPAEGPPRG
jgi:hypothetical protein